MQSTLRATIGTLRELSVATTAAEFNQILVRDDYTGRVQEVDEAYVTLATDLCSNL